MKNKGTFGDALRLTICIHSLEIVMDQVKDTGGDKETVQLMALFSFQKFSRFSIKSNLAVHICSTKYK